MAWRGNFKYVEMEQQRSAEHVACGSSGSLRQLDVQQAASQAHGGCARVWPSQQQGQPTSRQRSPGSSSTRLAGPVRCPPSSQPASCCFTTAAAVLLLPAACRAARAHLCLAPAVRPQVPPALNRFTRTLDKNMAESLFKLLLKYRPEVRPSGGRWGLPGGARLVRCRACALRSARLRHACTLSLPLPACRSHPSFLTPRHCHHPPALQDKAAKKERLMAAAAAREAGQEAEKKKPVGWRGWLAAASVAPACSLRRALAACGCAAGSARVHACRPLPTPTWPLLSTHTRTDTHHSSPRASSSQVVVKYGINHVTQLVESGKAQCVVIAHDVDPIEIVVWLPALCKKMGVPYCIVKVRCARVAHAMARLGGGCRGPAVARAHELPPAAAAGC